MKLITKIYALLCILATIWIVAQFAWHTPIQTQFTALLPQNTLASPYFVAADKFQEQQFNQQVIVLIGANNADKAFQAASEIEKHWQQSGLFAQVDGKIEPDLAVLRQSVQSLGVATLPAKQVRQLYEHPTHYFQERAEAAVNPFSGSLLSLEEDWLGFGQFIFEKQGNKRLNWHSEYAMLYTEYEDKTWVWLRARLHDAEPNPALLTLLEQTKSHYPSNDYVVLATGGSLFAADAKQSAERESSWMSVVGLSLTFSLLWLVFRTWRVFWVILPLTIGVLWGLVSSVIIFGEIHALTLVIGTSLVGVLVDFPLHWLAPSLFSDANNKWHSTFAMRRVLPSFLISLMITVLGYVLLWFTPLPVLQQTAVFSAAALLGAFTATALFLPYLLANHQSHTTWLARLFFRLPEKNMGKLGRIFLFGGMIFLLLGISKSHWQDDIRQWANMRPDLLADARQIAKISGVGVGQTVLLVADSSDELLKLNQMVEHRLQQHGITSTQSLNQWILPTDEQIALKKHLLQLAKQAESFTPLLTMGVPEETIQTALYAAANAPNITLSDSLTVPQAEGFRDLYVGEIAGKSVGLMRVSDTIETIALPDGATWLDKRTQLNQQFTQTRNQAAWLKVGSFVLAWVVLIGKFGIRRGSLILAVPIAAILGTIGLLGWLDVSVGLFAMFGLLLAAAIGVDYSVYVLTAPETVAARLAGITLAAMTTEISFVLLIFSATPAVATFGMSVAIGVGLSWFGAVKLLFRQPETSETWI